MRWKSFWRINHKLSIENEQVTLDILPELDARKFINPDNAMKQVMAMGVVLKALLKSDLSK